MIIRWILSHSVIILVLLAILFAIWKVDDLRSWLPEVATRDSSDHVADTAAKEEDHSTHSQETDANGAESIDDNIHAAQNENEKPVEAVARTDKHEPEEDHEVDLAIVEPEAKDTGEPGLSTSEFEQDSGLETQDPQLITRQVEPSGQQSDVSIDVSSEEGDDNSSGDSGSVQETTPAGVGGSLREKWLTARQAYWQQDLMQAEEQYLALRDLSPNDPDIVGELGNLYYARGDLQKAVETYYDAGLLLRDARRFQEARILADEIQRLDAEMAHELRTQLESDGANF